MELATNVKIIFLPDFVRRGEVGGHRGGAGPARGRGRDEQRGLEGALPRGDHGELPRLGPRRRARAGRLRAEGLRLCFS